jgi:hypothetical protein
MLSSSIIRSSSLIKISRDSAANFMRNYEHLGNVGLGVWHWGLIYEDSIIGVVSYGNTCFSKNRGWISQLASELDCKIIQLCRGGCSFEAPKGTATHLISLANKAMYKHMGPLIIVAYADTHYREIGTIYQASNACYTGQTNPKNQGNYIINGKKLSGWTVRKLYGTRTISRLREYDQSVIFIPLNSKHRYIMIAASPRTKKRFRKLITSHIRTYPKRADLGVMAMHS